MDTEFFIMNNDSLGVIGCLLYGIISFLTFIYLTLFDGVIYTWWNWVIILPINKFLGLIWPIYWVMRVVRYLF